MRKVTTNRIYNFAGHTFQAIGTSDPEIRGRQLSVVWRGNMAVGRIVSRFGPGPRGGDRRYYDVTTRSGRELCMNSMEEAVAECAVDLDKDSAGLELGWHKEYIQLKRSHSEAA